MVSNKVDDKFASELIVLRVKRTEMRRVRAKIAKFFVAHRSLAP